jgi:hypothetical protein
MGTCNDGLVIDLSTMKDVISVDTEARTVK